MLLGICDTVGIDDGGGRFGDWFLPFPCLSLSSFFAKEPIAKEAKIDNIHIR